MLFFALPYCRVFFLVGGRRFEKRWLSLGHCFGPFLMFLKCLASLEPNSESNSGPNAWTESWTEARTEMGFPFAKNVAKTLGFKHFSKQMLLWLQFKGRPFSFYLQNI